MTKAEQFEALALRCEQATGPDGNLNKTILRALGYTWRGMDYWHSDNKRIWINPSNFTASLDAALTLVPEGMRPSVGQNVHHGYWHAFVQSIVDSTPHQLGGAVSNTSGALALCAAALRARAQMERGE
jgi:hypothetical protein